MCLSFFLYPTSPGFISCDKPELVRGTEPIIGPPLHLSFCHSLFPPISYHLDLRSIPALPLSYFPRGTKKQACSILSSLPHSSPISLSPFLSSLSRIPSLSFPRDPHRNHQSSFFGGLSPHSGKKGNKTPLLDPRERFPSPTIHPTAGPVFAIQKPPQQRNAPDPVGHCFSSQ